MHLEGVSLDCMRKTEHSDEICAIACSVQSDLRTTKLGVTAPPALTQLGVAD